MQHVTPNSPPDNAYLARNTIQTPPNLHLFGMPTLKPTPPYCTEIQLINPRKCRCVGFFQEKFLGEEYDRHISNSRNNTSDLRNSPIFLLYFCSCAAIITLFDLFDGKESPSAEHISYKSNFTRLVVISF